MNKFRFFSHTVIKFGAVISSAAMLLSLTACSHSSQTSESSANNDADAATVVVGLNTKTNKPFNYLDEDGNITGYEAQLLRKVDDLLPQYKFEYKALDWPNLLVSLDTGKIKIAASSLQLNDERKQKYGYTREAVSQYVVKVAVPETDDTIHSVADLAGSTLYAWNGEATAQILEGYNAAHPDKKINLKYGDWTFEQVDAALASGEIKAKVTNTVNVAYDKKIGKKPVLKSVGQPLISQNTHFLLDKKDVQLRKDLDGAIKKLRADGTLKRLSQKYLGGDFSEPVKETTAQF